MRYLSSGLKERKSMGEKEIPQLSFTSEEVENGSALRMMSSERVCVYCVSDVVPVLVEKGLWEKERECGERVSEGEGKIRGRLHFILFCPVHSCTCPVSYLHVTWWCHGVLILIRHTQQLLHSHKHMDTHPNVWFGLSLWIFIDN